MTNFVTIRQSVDRLLEIEARLAEEGGVTTKKERLRFDRERERMNRNLEGVRELEALPDAIFVVDPKKEAIAVASSRSGTTPRSLTSQPRRSNSARKKKRLEL